MGLQTTNVTHKFLGEGKGGIYLKRVKM